MDNAVWIEIESLRRATLTDLREKYREVFQEGRTEKVAGIVQKELGKLEKLIGK